MNTIKRLLLVGTLGAAGFTAISCSDWTSTTRQGERGLAPFFAARDPQRATDRYIVVLADKASARATAARLAAAHGGSVRHVFDRVLGGFSVRLPAPAVDRLRADPAVLRVRQVESGLRRLGDHNYQLNAPWGLDRIDHRSSLNSWYSYSETGSGVRAYIIDSGIRTAHTQFGGRASIGFNANPQDGTNGQDCNGHGTHVAGIVGGSTYGAAKQAILVGVKVNNGCVGTIDPDDEIAGINWVATNHIKPAVANMSIWGPVDDDIDQAVTDAVTLGIPFVVIAGNANGASSCNFSPARVASAITVGATNNTDARAAFSNIGTCIDLFAPGENILSAWSTSNSATNTLSGTSQAAPHVAGAVARFLQFRTTASPSEVASVIVSRASQNELTNVGTGSPNLLLYTHLNDASTSGPTSCSNGSQQSWTATASGGVGSTFTFTWQRGSPTGFGNGMVWVNVGTGATYSQTCTPEPGTNSLWLRVNATDEFGFHRTVFHSVNVT